MDEMNDEMVNDSRGDNDENMRIKRIADYVFSLNEDCDYTRVDNYLLCRTDSGYTVKNSVTGYYQQYFWED